jgi:hypothetical protein
MSTLTPFDDEFDSVMSTLTPFDEFDSVTSSCGQILPSTLSSITDAADVDASNKVDGSVLVFNTTNNKWTSTITFDKQINDGGNF